MLAFSESGQNSPSSDDPPPLSEAASEWIDDLAVKGIVTRSHAHNVRGFVRWCQGQGAVELERVTTSLIKKYVQMRQETISPKTNAKLSENYLKQPCAMRRSRSSLAEQRVALQAIKDKWVVKTNPRSRFRSEKMRRLFIARDQALAATLMSTGMRVGEALNLKIESYD